MNEEYDDIYKENHLLKKKIQDYKKNKFIHRDVNICSLIIFILIILTEITASNISLILILYKDASFL